MEIGVILFLSINTLQIHSWNRQIFKIVFGPTSFQCSLLYPLESTENFFRGYKKGILGQNQWTDISKGKRNGWSRHIWCAILLNYKMDLLHMPSLDRCFMQQGVKFTEVRLIISLFTGTLVWYHTHTDTAHWRAGRLTHQYKYTLTPLVMYSQQLPLLR